MQIAMLNMPIRNHYDRVLEDYLQPVQREEDFQSLTIRQQTNVMQYMKEYHSKILDDDNGDHKDSIFGTVASGRDPNKAFGSQITFDGLATLRTNHSDVWLLPSPGKLETYGKYGRKVSMAEKCRMIGICPGSVKDMSDAAVEKALGNCIAVQAMACVWTGAGSVADRSTQ